MNPAWILRDNCIHIIALFLSVRISEIKLLCISYVVNDLLRSAKATAFPSVSSKPRPSGPHAGC